MNKTENKNAKADKASHSHSHGEHSHPHGMHSHAPDTLNRTLIVAIVLNLVFVAVEAVVGLRENALSLLSDAGHNLLDVFSLVLALLAFKLAQRKPSKQFTYGGKKATVLVSLLNAVLLLGAVAVIAVEGIGKLVSPSAVSGEAISLTAGVGIVVNGVTTLMLMSKRKDDLNLKGAFLHMLADTLVSVGVVISGIAIKISGNGIIDPIVSLAIAAIILFSTWSLLWESLKLALDASPKGLKFEDVEKAILETPHVKGVYHIHIWAISTMQTAMTAHVVLDSLSNASTAKTQIRTALQQFHITHCTLETEEEGEVPEAQREVFPD